MQELRLKEAKIYYDTELPKTADNFSEVASVEGFHLVRAQPSEDILKTWIAKVREKRTRCRSEAWSAAIERLSKERFKVQRRTGGPSGTAAIRKQEKHPRWDNQKNAPTKYERE